MTTYIAIKDPVSNYKYAIYYKLEGPKLRTLPISDSGSWQALIWKGNLRDELEVSYITSFGFQIAEELCERAEQSRASWK